MPNFDPAWLVLTFPVAIIIAAVLRSPRHPKKRQQEAASNKDRTPTDAHDPDRPSADFAALIDTIIAEGRAYRREEQREDRGKKRRDWVTIVLIGLTFGAVCWQVHEMIKVYDPIKTQADAAKISADAAKVASEAAVARFRKWPNSPTLSEVSSIRWKGKIGHGLKLSWIDWLRLLEAAQPLCMEEFTSTLGVGSWPSAS